MPADSNHKDWGPVSLAGTTILGIQTGSYDEQIGILEEGADFDQGPTLSGVTFRNPQFRFTTNRASTLISTLAGVKGIFIATLRAFYQGVTVGGGAIVFTTNALSYIGARDLTGAYRESAKQNITIKTTWADSVTHPVSITTL